MAYSVYLSSTLDDLKDERDEVHKTLGPHAQIKHSYEASPTPLIQSCIDDVAKSDVYVLIVGLRYGYQPVDPVLNPRQLSITELEYQCAVDKNKPRFVFVKNPKKVAATDSDSYTKLVDPALIESFRKRVGTGSDQRPAQFADLKDLSSGLLEAFLGFKNQRERTAATLMQPLGFDAQHPAELVTDVVILCAKGTDSKAANAINSRAGADARFSAAEVSPDDPQLLLSVSSATRSARAAAFLITPAALARMNQKPAIELAMATLNQRGCKVFLLLDGVAGANLPPSWVGSAEAVVEATGIADATSNALTEAYATIRASSPSIANDRRLGIPCVVVALTDAAAQALAAAKTAAFDDFKGPQRATRRKQFDKLRRAITKVHPTWPQGFYGQRAEEWHPFGPTGPTSAELLNRTFDRINSDHRPGSRERRLLRDYRLQPRPLSFDWYCNDRFGSRAMLEDARDQGCLLLLDEIALLSPKLREHIDSFVSGHRVAVVSANPCDPMHLSTSDLLDEFSHLHVGSLFTRFKDQEDPRCELSLNSTERLQRWLRLVLPEFVNTLSFQESQPELVARSSELLG